MENLAPFFELLQHNPTPQVFNPWWEHDGEHDLIKEAPAVRRTQLSTFLLERVDSVRYVLVAEALGYQGGHFTGIPMTSERLLLGELRDKGIHPQHVFQRKAERTSRPGLQAKGFNEPTATIVWTELIQHRITHQVILWNAFPWHPYHSDKGMLSNRTPAPRERLAGREILRHLQSWLPQVIWLALGRQAQAQLQELGVVAHPLRHPAHGGANEFRRGFAEVLRQFPPDPALQLPL